MKPEVVSIYGFGRFGKLWSEILAEDFQVKVYSRSGIARRQVRTGIEICDEKALFHCDALFFCVAISCLEAVLRKSSSYCRGKTTFFDTCSVKVYPARWMQTHLPAGSKIIATHPMFGPDSYQKTDRKLPIVMCNISADTETFDWWSHYFTAKLLQVESMSPEKHDQLTAYSQGITHYVGRLLAELQLQPTVIDTLGYRKMLEVMGQTCNDSWQLFLDLQNYNPYAMKMRKDLDASIAKINRELSHTKE